MSSLTIALDVMGGDIGPHVTIPAAAQALAQYPELHFILVGHQYQMLPLLTAFKLIDHPRVTIIHASEAVGMADKPSVAVRGLRDSSMRVALTQVKEGKAQACVSAGNTGALMALAKLIVKPLAGVKRPALIAAIPQRDGGYTHILDLGANVSCDANELLQFAVMGSELARNANLSSPRVALLNIGEEDIKGNELVKQAAVLLQQHANINYVGYIEGNDIFSHCADVIVCDGFVGNIALKTCEGVVDVFRDVLQQSICSSWWTRLLGWLLKPTLKRYLSRLNPDRYNGASLIGLRGIVVKSHGNADKTAFVHAIEQAIHEVQRQIPARIADNLTAQANGQS